MKTSGVTSQKLSKIFHHDDPTHAISLTHVIADRQLYPQEWLSVCKQVLQVAKSEGSVALVLTHYGPAMGV